MNSRSENRTLALAGIVQACYLARSIARTGLASQDAVDASLASIFVTDPDDASEVFAGGNGANTGLRVLQDMLGEFNNEHMEVVRYAIAIMDLQKKLAGRPDMLRELGAGIQSLKEQRQLGEATAYIEDAIISGLANLYDGLLGQIEPRIIIYGNQRMLDNQDNRMRIRALLLAGVRAAVLWRQMGGSKWQLLFSRKAINTSLDQLLSH